MTMRLKKGWEVGDAGAVYEFEIKVPKITGVNMTNDEFEMEARDSLEDFVADLKRRYKWIGKVYQTGRSGGWLAIEDPNGKATVSSTRAINERIKKEMGYFVDNLKSAYPA